MTPKETRSAIVVFALLLPSLAALFWSAQASVPRPGALRSFTVGGQEHAAFVFDRALHVLDAQGRRVTRQPLEALGLREEPNDLDVTVDAAGKIQAWLFEDGPPRIVRCDVAAASAPRLEGCAEIMAGAQLKMAPASLAVHIAVEPARDRLFVADADGHGVRAFSLRGERLAESRPGTLFFPNRLRVVGDRLLVADNDHRRLVWLDVAADRPGFEPRRVLDIAAHPQARGVRKAADFALMRGDGGEPAGLWLVAVRQGQKNGQVLLHGPGLAPRGAADLGGYADPLIVDRLGDDLLAADFDGIALYRIGADGRFLGVFGEGEFAREMEAGRERRAARTYARYAGLAGIALTLVVGFLLAWRFGERKQR